MLVHKMQKDDVIGLILNTGQEVIGKVDHSDEDQLWLLKPFKVILTQQGPAMIPMTMLVDYDKDESAIPIKHVAYASSFKITGGALADYTASTTKVAVVNPTNTIVTP